MLLLNYRCLYIFWYKPTICFIVYVAYEQKEIEQLKSENTKKHHNIQYLEEKIRLHENTDTDIGMIVYYYTIYTTLFLKNK